MSKRSLTNKVIVLTGASSGIGRATALALAAEGAALHLVARREQLLEATCREALEHGAALARAYSFDVRDEQAFTRMADQLNAEGGVDVVINNAGVSPLRSFFNTTKDDWQWTFDINLHALVTSTRLFLPKMLERGYGTIVNISSLAGLIGNHIPSYSASKFAVVGLSESLALEFGDRGIDVVVVCPGVIKTEMVDATVRTGRVEPDMVVALEKVFDRAGVDPSIVARDIVSAIRRPRFLVTTPTHASIIYRAHQRLPGLMRKLARRLLN